jgi:hypothetical protein
MKDEYFLHGMHIMMENYHLNNVDFLLQNRRGAGGGST